MKVKWPVVAFVRAAGWVSIVVSGAVVSIVQL